MLINKKKIEYFDTYKQSKNVLEILSKLHEENPEDFIKIF